MKKYLNFKGKVSVVTGAGSGIGKEVSIKLSDLGSTVILIGRSKKVTDLEKKIKKRNVASYICDLSDEQSVKNLYKKIIKKYKKIDILINSAGVTASGNIDSLDTDRNILKQTEIHTVWDTDITRQNRNTMKEKKTVRIERQRDGERENGSKSDM